MRAVEAFGPLVRGSWSAFMWAASHVGVAYRSVGLAGRLLIVVGILLTVGLWVVGKLTEKDEPQVRRKP